ALLKKTLHKTPLVFEVRDVWPEAVIAVGAVKNRLVQKVLYLLEKLIYNKSDIIVPLSVDMKKSITARYPYLEQKIPFVVENIAEVNNFPFSINTWAYFDYDFLTKGIREQVIQDLYDSKNDFLIIPHSYFPKVEKDIDEL